MKIGMITYSVYEYDNRVHRAAESLKEHGDSVDVICLGKGGDPPSELVDGVRLFRIQERTIDETHPGSYMKKMISFFLRVFFVLTRLHLKNHYEIIHYHNIPDIGIFSTLAAKLLGAKIILDIHDTVPEFSMRKFGYSKHHGMTRILLWMEKISCMYADHVFTVTNLWKRVLSTRSVPPNKCSVILNAPYPPLFDPYLGDTDTKPKKSKTFTILYHGALNEHFGVDTAIRAMAYVTDSVPDVVFQIVGNGRERKNLLSLSEQLHLNGHVHFHNPVPRKEIPHFIQEADMGVVPKRADTFADTALSSKLLEFAYMRKPVVVSRTTASQTYFDQSMVRFFEPDNPEDLARQIIDLAKHPEKTTSMIRNVDRFNLKHPWRIYRNRYFAVIQRLSRRNKSGGHFSFRSHLTDEA